MLKKYFGQRNKEKIVKCAIKFIFLKLKSVEVHSKVASRRSQPQGYIHIYIYIDAFFFFYILHNFILLPDGTSQATSKDDTNNLKAKKKKWNF